MSRRAVIVGLASAAALILAACGSSEESAFPDDAFAIVANADIGTGPSRVLVAISDVDGSRHGSPDIPVRLSAAPLDTPEQVQTVNGIFTWMVEGVTGMYRAEFDFHRPGIWQVTVSPEEGEDLEPGAVNVNERTFSPNVGESAVVAPTPTLEELPFEELTTDPRPDPRFYELSLEEALENGRPTVLVFSTPAYCQTSACGPLLDMVKDAAGSHPEVNFIHVEVYTGLTDPDFAPDAGHLAPAAGPDYWNLISEPWVFVIDETGIVTARFEGVMGADELAEAL